MLMFSIPPFGGSLVQGESRFGELPLLAPKLATSPIETTDTMSIQPPEPLVEIACEYFPAEVRNEYAALLQKQAEGALPTAKGACRRIAEKLVERRVTPRLALKLHLATMESVIASMGPACTKRVLTSGDVLVLELMTALADAYTQQPAPPGIPAPRRKNWFATSVR